MTSFLDTIEASAKAATQGPRTIEAMEKLITDAILHDGREGDVNAAIALLDGQEQIKSDAAFMGICSPDNILALVRIARESQTVIDESSATVPPSLGALRRLQDALDALPQ